MPLSIWQAAIQDEAGNVIDDPDLQLRVRSEVSGFPLVSIYEDNAGNTPLDNPFFVEDARHAFFYVAGGTYRVDALIDGVVVAEWPDVQLGTNAGTDFQTSFVPRGAWSAIVTYARGDYVEHEGCNFVSNQNTNLNHEPDVDPVPTSDAWWTVAGKSSRYDLLLWDNLNPQAGEVMLRTIIPAPIKFLADMLGSIAVLEAAPFAEAVFSIQKNGVEFGTVTFDAGEDEAVLDAPETTFSAGDILSVVAPSPQDPSLSGLTMTLTAYRT